MKTLFEYVINQKIDPKHNITYMTFGKFMYWYCYYNDNNFKISEYDTLNDDKMHKLFTLFYQSLEGTDTGNKFNSDKDIKDFFYKHFNDKIDINETQTPVDYKIEFTLENIDFTYFTDNSIKKYLN